MRRDSNSVSGMINFPIKDPNYRNTNEDGMFVRLVVIDNDWMECAGGYQSFSMDESFIEDDIIERYTGDMSNVLSSEEMAEELNKENEYVKVHFPNLYSSEKDKWTRKYKYYSVHIFV